MTKGKLTVKLETDSYFLGSAANIEVRDSSFTLVDSDVRSHKTLELDPGLYEVSAVLQDGQKHRKMIQLDAGETKDVLLKSNRDNTRLAMSRVMETPVTQKKLLSEFPPGLLEGRADNLTSLEAGTSADTKEIRLPETLSAEISRALNVIEEETLQSSGIKLLSSPGARIHSHEQGGYWKFEPDDDLQGVPKAEFNVQDQQYHISLPVNPRGYFPENACEVHVSNSGSGSELVAWIDPSRTVASALQHMLSSGYLLNAIDVAREATELLLYKYSDPTGAALGGMLLNKAGLLAERRNWVENLARDFDWMPDGKVLLAELLTRDRETPQRAFELLSAASEQRMMFTECYSLMLKVLRSWPFDDYKRDCAEILKQLGSRNVYVDWGSITFSNWSPTGN